MKLWVILFLFISGLSWSQDKPTIYLYANGDTSVIVYPWKEHRRAIVLYDLKGKQTFELEDVRLSYTVWNKLSFHPNGAVKKIEQHSNPGASLYSYKSTMTFDTLNNPLTKRDEKFPSDLQDLEKSNTWFWNSKQKNWVPQETMECQPVKP